MRRRPGQGMQFPPAKEKASGQDDTNRDGPNFLSEMDDENALDGQSQPHKPAAGPPNGGLKAWLQVLGSFFIYFNTWGKFNLDSPPPPRTTDSKHPSDIRTRNQRNLLSKRVRKRCTRNTWYTNMSA